MSDLDRAYRQVPGTTIFDAEQSAKGYHLNQFCMSLATAENRAAYLADERAYLDAWPLREGQRRALLERDLNAAIAEGGNIYFLAKWGATLGLSFQQMAGSMTGMTEEEYRAMMAGGGRPAGRRLDHAVLEAAHAEPAGQARISAAVFTSHVPAIGAAMDHGKTQEPYWEPVFAGYEPTRRWAEEHVPDVVVLVYNDHANAFDLSLVPTFVLGTGAVFPVADEGYGPRPVPEVEGDPEFAAHLAHSLIREDFDLTLAQQMPVDHGLTVPLSLVFGEVERWPCKVVPLHVNVVQYPVPSGARCFALGRALRRAVESYHRPLDVQVWGTGGMSHQLQGPRAGLINREWDNAFLDRLVADPAGLAGVPHLEYVEQAGSEGIELVMWLIARGALSDVDGDGTVSAEHRFYHVPASNTAVGHLILTDHSPTDHPQPHAGSAEEE
ncbi:protocatechuate 4,5-dioxygenase subunit alpha [Kitasatospora sp. NPDC051853]|uniref:protocatechuate 4,5-dioxygenase subunit alpha n=1 Tax=Kitasatospora sp. NPDC051853 TaxID=3364058 RepID=UPI003794EC04